MQCPGCGFDNAEEARFCSSCGAPLAHSAPERRQITVMFCDVVGSTPMTEQLDLEEFRQVLRSYQETGVEVITRFGGYVARYLGDGLLIYFGYPQARGDDALRTVHAALETVEAIEAAGLRDKVKIMIGGGTVDQDICTYAGADAFGKDAMAAVTLAKQWIGGK